MSSITHGTATVLAGQTYVTVTHGLATAPAVADITLQPQDNLEGRDYWPSDPDALTFRINVSSSDMVDHVFTYSILTEAVVATGECDLIRKRVGLTATDVTDPYVMNYIEETEAWLGDQVGATLDLTTGTEAEKNAIRNLAAIYCYYHTTGTSSTGWTANIGPVTFSGAPEKVSMINDLWQSVKAFVRGRKAGYQTFKVGQANY